ncbi:hypothetical protein PJP10_01360 [Mycobacterium kansasii]
MSRTLAARAARSHHTASAPSGAARCRTPYTVPAGDEVPSRTMSPPRGPGPASWIRPSAR